MVSQLTSYDCRSSAWNALRGKWGTAAISILICALIMSLPSILYYTRFLAIVGTVLSVLLGAFTTYGQVNQWLIIARGGNPKVDDVFAASKLYGKVLLTYFLMGLYTFLWTLLFIIPGIIKAYAYSMTMHVLRDNPELTPSQAITRSQDLMLGNKFKLFVLQLTFIGWILLVAITFGIAAFWVSPYMGVAQCVFYNSICPQVAPPPIMPSTPEPPITPEPPVTPSAADIDPFDHTQKPGDPDFYVFDEERPTDDFTDNSISDKKRK